MADHWFRIYNTVRHDRKIRKLSDQTFRAWVMLLTLASEENGKIPDSFEDLAMELHLSVAKTKAVLDTLVSSGLIEKLSESGYIPHKWEERQFKSDSSTTRVKRFRERQRNVSETAPELEQNIAEQNIEGFELFYAAMPKKEKRKEASVAYSKALLKTTAEILLSAARSYANRYKGKDPEFTTNPVTWLGKERWLDEANGRAGPTLEEIEVSKDKADRLLKRGIYATKYQ